ncbi:unnamed protein product [Cuscuta epithymum]|uniref:DUF4218 domain-containing protein n=1 Tax=Cuscuta epithymum TaxID=186058 RepID=A0AAV0D9P3_9ASTE|nr:unnamed protein product [Cuscuta epithymum]
MEKVFPPGFFDVSEHLIIHLPYEARVCGPPQYRWMYMFERFLGTLKKKITNKAHIEASICSAYIDEELSTFASYYFDSSIRSKRMRFARHDEAASSSGPMAFSIFNHPGRGNGKSKKRFIVGEEMKVAYTYILLNCAEVRPYYDQFVYFLQSQGHTNIDLIIANNFSDWYTAYVLNPCNGVSDPFIRALAGGISSLARAWPAYIVGGYTFHTTSYGARKKTFNSGICVRSSNFNNATTDWIGTLEEILEVDILCPHPLRVVLFKCKWVDPVRGMQIHNKYNIVDVKLECVYKVFEPFILAQQASQVFFLEYPGSRGVNARGWKCACKVKSRRTIEGQWKDVDDSPYQIDETQPPPIVEITEEFIELQDGGLQITVPIEEVIEAGTVTEDVSPELVDYVEEYGPQINFTDAYESDEDHEDEQEEDTDNEEE